MKDHFQIWERAIGFRPEIGKKYPNPFRPDSHAGAYFQWVGSYLRLKDWANSYYHNINCFDAVSIKLLGHKIDEAGDWRENWNRVMDFISGVDKFDPEKIEKAENYQHKLIAEPRELTDEELVYYQQFGISDQNLSDDMVTGCEFYKYNSRLNPDRFTVRYPSDLAYILWLKNGHKKIYRPLNQEFKFTTDTKPEDIWVYGSGGLALVFEGHKDARVAHNLGFNSIGLQSCTIPPANLSILALKQRFSRIIYVGDWDNAGIVNGADIAAKMGIEHKVFPPAVRDKLISINKKLNDIAALYKNIGHQRCISALNYIVNDC